MNPNRTERRDRAYEAAAVAGLPGKPLYTNPCNGCGLCCLLELCHIGEAMFPGVEPPCPALVIRPGQARCGAVIVEEAAGMEPVISRTLGIGRGCSMPDATTSLEEIESFNRRAQQANEDEDRQAARD